MWAQRYIAAHTPRTSTHVHWMRISNKADAFNSLQCFTLPSLKDFNVSSNIMGNTYCNHGALTDMILRSRCRLNTFHVIGLHTPADDSAGYLELPCTQSVHTLKLHSNGVRDGTLGLLTYHRRGCRLQANLRSVQL